MQLASLDMTCPECSKGLLDLGDEMVCPRCGITEVKQVLEQGFQENPRGHGWQALGSYMGPRSAPREERTARGIRGTDGGYDHLKLVSDHAGRDEGAAEECVKLIERVGEKLSLSSATLAEAAAMARKVLDTVHPSRRVTVAAVSAYSLISACRMTGTATANPREILATHTALGRRVTSSSVIQLALESPIRTYAPGPEQCVSRVLARLSTDQGLLHRLAKEGAPMARYLNALRDCGRELLSLADRTEMCGKRPCALAAAAVYSAETALSRWEGRGRRVTQRQLAECAGTSEYTVREQYAMIFTPAVEKALARRTLSLRLRAGR